MTARKMMDFGYREVNLNLGCPSGTVVAKGKGSGFLSFPEKLDAFLDEIYSGLADTGLDISVKTRIGRYEQDEFYELLDIYNKYPISAAKEDFKIDYKKLKKNIIKIKKVDNEVINKVSYKKYTVSMKKSDAYNLIYDKDVIDEKNLSGTVDVQILVDKSANFIYEIDYVIDNLNSDSNNKIKYSVQVNNFDFNNNNEINLPF